MKKMHDHYDHHITYKRTWYGKQMAMDSVYGDWTSSYVVLPIFMAAVMHYINPGTMLDIQAEPHPTLPE